MTHNDSDALGCALVVDYFSQQQFYVECDESVYIDNNNKPIAIHHTFNAVETAKERLTTLVNILEKINDSIIHDDIVIDNELNTLYNIIYGEVYDNDGIINIPSHLFITDLSISSDILDRLDNVSKIYGIELLYVDHHTSSVGNHKRYPWCNVTTIDDTGKPRSACKYLFELLVDHIYTSEIICNYKAFEMLIDDISNYDTWYWKTEPRLPKRREEWTKIIIDNFGNIYDAYNSIHHDILTHSRIYDTLCDVSDYALIIKQDAIKRENVIARYSKQVVYTMGYNLGFNTPKYSSALFALVILPNNYGNDLMEYIYTNYERVIDVVIGIYPESRTLSFRRSPFSTINLAEFAERYGGGGHEAAAGARLNTDKFMEYLRYYYDLLDK
jgi:oligoribonuclease NrnB/cAMP/cGMP phosphodiesterase (DHH superfamily)